MAHSLAVDAQRALYAGALWLSLWLRIGCLFVDACCYPVVRQAICIDMARASTISSREVYKYGTLAVDISFHESNNIHTILSRNLRK